MSGKLPVYLDQRGNYFSAWVSAHCFVEIGYHYGRKKFYVDVERYSWRAFMQTFDSLEIAIDYTNRFLKERKVLRSIALNEEQKEFLNGIHKKYHSVCG